jgi:hypothetical protein
MPMETDEEDDGEIIKDLEQEQEELEIENEDYLAYDDENEEVGEIDKDYEVHK